MLPCPLPLHVRCPVEGCPKAYANQAQTAIRHSLLRHLKTGFHPGLTVAGTEWQCAACGAKLARKVSAHKCPLGPLSRPGAGDAASAFRQECH